MKYLIPLLLLFSPLLWAQTSCDTEEAALNVLNEELSLLQARMAQLTDTEIPDAEQALADCQNPPETEPEPDPVGTWQEALDPYIPDTPRTVVVLPDTALTPVLLEDDGTDACTYLKCNRSHIGLHDWVGWSFDTTNGVIRLIAMGGHADLGANSVYAFDVSTLSWTRTHDYDQPAAPFPDLSNHDPDSDGVIECVPLEDGPFGTHTYDGLVHIPTIDATLMVRSKGYSPNWSCDRDYDLYPSTMWLWSDSGGWIDTGLSNWTFPKTAYDAARDKLYIASQSGINGDDGLWEMDPHTMTVTKLDGLWNGKGGAADFDPDNRTLWIYGRGSGLFEFSIALDGTVTKDKPVTAAEWGGDAYNSGLAVSQGIVVGWVDSNTFLHYDSSTGVVEEVTADGDAIPSQNRIMGKFDAVPGRPGVFIGMNDNYGLILYRAF